MGGRLQVGDEWLTELEGRARAQLDEFVATGSDADRLLHDLQVHRIELEMQNEEMIRSQVALERTCNRFRAVLDAAPLGYLALDATGRICDVNPLGAQLLGRQVSELVDSHLQGLLRVADADRLHIQLRDSLATSTAQTFSVALEQQNRPAKLLLHIVPNSDGVSTDPSAWVFIDELSPLSEGVSRVSTRSEATVKETLTSFRELLPRRILLELDASAADCRAMVSSRDLERICFLLCLYALAASHSEENAVLRIKRLKRSRGSSRETARQELYLKISLANRPETDDSEESGAVDGSPELANLVSVVHGCGGLVEYGEAPGVASRIDVLLPLAQEKGLARACEPSRPAIRDCVVLVVDDDNAVLKAVSRVLTLAGYQVVAASSGAEALEIARTQHQRLDVLLSDVRMPGMNGGELGQHMASLRPDVLRVYMSGDIGDVVLEPGATLVSKPFHPDSLVRLLDTRMPGK